MKKALFFFAIIAASLSLLAQENLLEELPPAEKVPVSRTETFVTRDTQALKLAIFLPEKQNEQHACVIYAHGGGFIGGSRYDEAIPYIAPYFLREGFILISIDYRHAMANQNSYGVISGMKNYQRAIEYAAEDLLEATSYVIKNLLTMGSYTINPNYIITCGSSAGAITVLQADYYLHNEAPFQVNLPDTFNYAGVLSFSGGIFSKHGKIKYEKGNPAPTLLCHGMDDNLVPYNKIQFFNIGMFGSNALAKRFEKYDYPYHVRRYENLGHEVAARHAYEPDLIMKFIQDFVFDHKFLQIDERYYSPAIKHYEIGSYKIKDLKKFK
ncbi:MAG: alpha/beta hydrolase [Bacteroidales bacterium]|nr:alpha/beta hydrolase [Bacteroidales bacterium]